MAELRNARKPDGPLQIGFDRSVSAADLKLRFVERDRRLAADSRSAAEIFLGDPPAARSALARRNQLQERIRNRTGPATVADLIDDLIFSLRR